MTVPQNGLAPAYINLMEETGFYRKGKPTAGVLQAQELGSDNNGQLDKRIKYRAVLDQSGLNVTDIYELDGSPCIYFKYIADANPSATELAHLQKLAWNHGLAPILWIITPAKALLYNCYSKPVGTEGFDQDKHLIEVFENSLRDLQRLKDIAGRLQFETGTFWSNDNAKQIDRNQRVDRALLKDLQTAEEILSHQGLDRSVAHALLGRSIFVSFLHDRHILKSQFFRSRYEVGTFTDLLNDKDKTYNLFEWIRVTFNGDLFPLTRNTAGKSIREQDEVSQHHLHTVRDLLLGVEMSTGQRRFWPYCFDVIPIELISSIYEMFAHAADSQTALDRSTHYTPINLVDLTLSQIFDGLPADSNILDLACGSGVFLVESFRRLVALRIGGGEEWSRKLVRDVLYKQIYGIDISSGAIQIAAFSLYLTALELDPDPQPPSALKFRELLARNLFAEDAFDEDGPFNKEPPFVTKEFGAIVGNPPWTRNSGNLSAIEYCSRRNYPLARKSIDQAFFWRAGDFTNDNTRIGLIIHAKPFFSHTSAALRAKKALLNRFNPKLMINLSDLRKDKLFPTSEAPALIIIADGHSADPEDYFTFVRPEHSESFKRHGIIEIGPEQIKSLSIGTATSDPDMLKVATWGSARDFALIQQIRNAFPTLEQLKNKNRWPAGQGFQAVGKQEAPELTGKKWIPSGAMPAFQINSRLLDELPLQTFHRKRDPEIYKGPLILTRRGLSGTAFTAAFTRDDLVYPDTYYGISFEGQDRYAHYLNGILNSLFATYYLFFTSSVWGIERDEIKPADLLRLPVPDLDTAPSATVSRIVEVEAQLRRISADHPIARDSSGLSRGVDALLRSLDEAVLDLYGLDKLQRILVRDGVNFTVDLRVKQEQSEALLPPQTSDIEIYAKQLMLSFEPFLKTLNARTPIADILDVRPSPLRVLRFELVPSPGRKKAVDLIPNQKLGGILSSIAELLPQRIAERVYSQRILRIYLHDTVYIVKPAQRRYWSRSGALNDADAILMESMSETNGSYQ